jgi:4-amino-4-deoxy-L-arabinose transferase-like glycosyltransferase
MAVVGESSADLRASTTPRITLGKSLLLKESFPVGEQVQFRTLFLMVFVGLAIRLIVMGFLYTGQLDPRLDHFRFGFETGRIARSIVMGEGFSNPLFGKTGPTAWMTPVYPYIVASFFKVFGIYTKAAAFSILSFNALTSALTCLPIFFFARKSLGSRVAKWAAWTWAFFPYAIYFPVIRIWETWLATLLLGLIFLITLELEDTDRISTWVSAGLLWGLAGLTSAVILLVLPFLQWRVSYLRRKQGRPWLAPNIVLGLVFIAVVCPWFVRNWRTFHTFVPFRDNAGLVLRLGTQGATDYWGPYELGPWNSAAEWQEFQRDGELKYMATKKTQALSFIEAHPGWYIWTSLRRAFFFWSGYWSLEHSYLQQEEWDPENIVFCSVFTILALVGLRKAWVRNNNAAILYTIFLLVFPLTYYFTSPELYYRRPLDPLMVVLAVYAVTPSRRPDKRVVAQFEESERLEMAAAD